MPPPERNARNDRGQRINEQIRISPIRLIAENGDDLGVIPTSEALDKAREASLDLVEVAPQAKPPVCKILDYGKFRYNQSRKQSNKGPKVHQTKQKEIRLRPKTDQHDIETKINQARRFLGQKDKVLVNVLFRGREMLYIDEGRRIMSTILEELDDIAKVEKPPSMEGRRMTAILTPRS